MNEGLKWSDTAGSFFRERRTGSSGTVRERSERGEHSFSNHAVLRRRGGKARHIPCFPDNAERRQLLSGKGLRNQFRQRLDFQTGAFPFPSEEVRKFRFPAFPCARPPPTACGPPSGCAGGLSDKCPEALLHRRKHLTQNCGSLQSGGSW